MTDDVIRAAFALMSESGLNAYRYLSMLRGNSHSAVGSVAVGSSFMNVHYENEKLCLRMAGKMRGVELADPQFVEKFKSLVVELLVC